MKWTKWRRKIDKIMLRFQASRKVPRHQLKM